MTWDLRLVTERRRPARQARFQDAGSADLHGSLWLTVCDRNRT
jgi:hypothetical protein